MKRLMLRYCARPNELGNEDIEFVLRCCFVYVWGLVLVVADAASFWAHPLALPTFFDCVQLRFGQVPVDGSHRANVIGGRYLFWPRVMTSVFVGVCWTRALPTVPYMCLLPEKTRIASRSAPAHRPKTCMRRDMYL